MDAKTTRDLAQDLDLLQSGWTPKESALAESPRLDDWELASVPEEGFLTLVGFVSDHPKLPGARRSIRTSPVVAMDEEAGWARTASRFYRLGDRMSPEVASSVSFRDRPTREAPLSR